MSEANWHVRIPDQTTKAAVVRFAKTQDRSIGNALRQLIRDGLVSRGVLTEPNVDQTAA
jgi:hypothetical protein